MIGRNGAARPGPIQAAWIYAQIVRWGQAPLSEDMAALLARAGIALAPGDA